MWGGNTNSDTFGDLWKFDGNIWTWVAGSDTLNPESVFETRYVPSNSSVVGGRGSYSQIWIDSKENVWVFGGNSGSGQTNDLWKFDGTYWTWMAGSSSQNNFTVVGDRVNLSVQTPLVLDMHRVLGLMQMITYFYLGE